jgi:hypothetical protein
LLEIQLQEAHHPKAVVHHLLEVHHHMAVVHHLQEVHHNKAVAHHLLEVRHNKAVVVRNVPSFGIKHEHLTISNNHHKNSFKKFFI